ncbi:MAG: hypothetical protein KQI81_24705 [Deltaproteobacteria bacterium]|nr:hypothetical protein [Deltaproteobacteria bacterium]
MENLTVKTGTTLMRLRFLLAPENSSTPPPGNVPPGNVTFWNSAKTLLWFVFSVLTALLVGQL